MSCKRDEQKKIELLLELLYRKNADKQRADVFIFFSLVIEKYEFYYNFVTITTLTVLIHTIFRCCCAPVGRHIEQFFFYFIFNHRSYLITSFYENIFAFHLALGDLNIT